MYSDYYEPSVEVFGGIWIFQIIYFFFVALVGIASYAAQSLSFYSIAKRRGINHPWLSWVPVGSLWILGCISDQYRYVVKREVKNKRKALLTLSIITVVLEVVLIVALVVFAVSIAGGLAGEIAGMEPSMEVMANSGFVGSLVVILVGSLAVSGVAIALAVLEYMALYDLYSSCDPQNNVVYMLLSIFVGVSMPILLFLCRNKDLGMPPKKQTPPPQLQEPTAWEPTDPEPRQDET